MKKEPIKVLIVDDLKTVREQLKVFLEASNIAVIGTANNGKDAIAKLSFLIPDIVLLDIEMPEQCGLVTARGIRDRFPKIKIILLSSYDTVEHIRAAEEVGAKGYLLKPISASNLENAIGIVKAGYSAYQSELVEKLLFADFSL
jgi:YesN/AraC family two-component response regulator